MTSASDVSTASVRVVADASHTERVALWRFRMRSLRLALLVGVGRAVRWATRLRGGGTALPGLVVERLSPRFAADALAALPYGVVVISGTNGKTTTTRMVAHLLRSSGLRVFTNPSGSNYSRGIVSALIGALDSRGRLHADVAVLELDEAHAGDFVSTVPPRFGLLLNVSRDQLERYTEIDRIARLLGRIAERTTGVLVLNRDDARVAALAGSARGAEIRYFGVSEQLAERFPSDDELYGPQRRPRSPDADVQLMGMDGQAATFRVGSMVERRRLRMVGGFNMVNAAAALALARAVLGGEASDERLLDAVADATPAFGRGEVLRVGPTEVELVLVKNPSGFRLCLESFSPEGRATMIAINDNDSDSRDVSWLWDVDFTSLAENGVPVVSGRRAHDMALRLHYDGITPGLVEPDIGAAIRTALASGPSRLRIYATYTAMLQARRRLGELTVVERID